MTIDERRGGDESIEKKEGVEEEGEEEKGVMEEKGEDGMSRCGYCFFSLSDLTGRPTRQVQATKKREKNYRDCTCCHHTESFFFQSDVCTYGYAFTLCACDARRRIMPQPFRFKLSLFGFCWFVVSFVEASNLSKEPNLLSTWRKC